MVINVKGGMVLELFFMDGVLDKNGILQKKNFALN